MSLKIGGPMKLYWLLLLIVGTHFGIAAPNALALDSKTFAELLPQGAPAKLDQEQGKWVDDLDTDISLEKGSRRVRIRHRIRVGDGDFRYGEVRHIQRGRLHNGSNRHRVIIIQTSPRRDRFHYGEFRRNDIFLRHDSLRHDRFRHNRLRHHRLRHHHLRHYRDDQDNFRLIIRD